MRRGARIAVMTIASAALVTGAVIAHDPWLLVRAQFERQRMAAGLGQANAQVAGYRWAYAYCDDAPPGSPILVLLHGFTGSKENWYPLARCLRGKYRLLIPDLPGWGESERKPGADYGYLAQAAHVDAFIRQVVGGRYGTTHGGEVVLIGHSMGGGIAAVAAAHYPHEIARVGLIDAAGVRFKDNQFGREVLAGRNPFEVSDRASLKRYIDTVFFRAQAKPWIPWPVSSGLIARRRADAAFEHLVLDRIGRGPESFAPGDSAKQIDQPALLLWGNKDVVIDPSAMDLYATQIPQAAKVLLDDCGHMSMVECSGAVAQAVDELIMQGKPR